jgi:hypothetical protein
MPLSPFSPRDLNTTCDENATVGFAEKDFGATLCDRAHGSKTSKNGQSEDPKEEQGQLGQLHGHAVLDPLLQVYVWHHPSVLCKFCIAGCPQP